MYRIKSLSGYREIGKMLQKNVFNFNATYLATLCAAGYFFIKRVFFIKEIYYETHLRR